MKLNLVLADAELELVPEMPDGAGEPGTRAPFQNIPVLTHISTSVIRCPNPSAVAAQIYYTSVYLCARNQF